MEHMFPDSSSFLSYRPSTEPNDYTLLGDKSQSNIAGCGTAVFSMNICLVLVRNSIHAPPYGHLSTPQSVTVTNQDAHNTTP